MLILGACMLHILVSSALYRPLATHVNILRRKRLGYVHTVEEDCIDDKKPCSYPGRSNNSNTQDALPIHLSQCCSCCQNNQVLPCAQNSESFHHQSLQGPNEMARKLQCKLATLHNTSTHSGSC